MSDNALPKVNVWRASHCLDFAGRAAIPYKMDRRTPTIPSLATNTMAHVYVAIPAGSLAKYAAIHGRIDTKEARKVCRIRVFTAFRITSKTLKFRGPCGRWHYYNVGVQPDNVVSLTRAVSKFLYMFRSCSLTQMLFSQCGDGICPQIPPEPVPGPLYELLKADFNTILELERLYDDEDREAREDKKAGDKRAKTQTLKEQREVLAEGRANKRARKTKSAKQVSRSTSSDGEEDSIDQRRLKQISDDAALALKISTGMISEGELEATMSSPTSVDDSFHTARSTFTDSSQDHSTSQFNDSDDEEMPTSVSSLLRKVKANERLESPPVASSSRLPPMVTTPIAPRLSNIVEMSKFLLTSKSTSPSRKVQ